MSKILKFLGTGSCFNTKAGNNSAYFIHNIGNKKRLVLFDCGETVFAKIQEIGLLNGIDEVFVLITHLHSDHVGSLSSLIFYLNYVLNIKPVVCFPHNSIILYLDLVGVSRDFYVYVNIGNIYYYIQAINQNHSKNISSFGYLFKLDSNLIYYSGDSKDISPVILDMFRAPNCNITEFYQDVTRYVNDAHMNINDLVDLFPKEERKRITLMHFDDKELESVAKKYGFRVARKSNTIVLNFKRVFKM